MSCLVYCSHDLLLRYWGLSAQNTRYIFQHIGTRTFKFAFLHTLDYLATMCNYKFDILFLQIGIYPTFTSEFFKCRETFGTIILIKRSSEGVNLSLHILWLSQMSINLNVKQWPRQVQLLLIRFSFFTFKISLRS